MSVYRLLVVDDNESILSSVRTALKSFQVLTANSIVQARDIITDELDIVLLDLVFDESRPDVLQGLDFLQYIHEHYPNLPTIIMTNYSSTDIIVQAIKTGAIDYLNKKELDWTQWKIRLEHYCKNSKKIKQLEEINKTLEEKYDPSDIIGVSKEIEYIRKRIKDLAKNSDDVTILITGETGTGKNLTAKYFRKHSIRKINQFIEFSIYELSESLMESELFGHVKGAFTGAIQDKKGLFEEADGGILFLDEVGDYDLRIQKKIMRFLEEKEITRVGSSQKTKINVQLILATNHNIPDLIKEGKFREDLYHRINRIHIYLPPLRERKQDIVFLADYYFNYFKEKEKTNLIKITPEVYDIFEAYTWPGNVRELQSVIWDACTRARLNNDKNIRSIHLRDEIKSGIKSSSQSIVDTDSLEIRKATIELDEIEKVLVETNGRKNEAAQILKMDVDGLRYKIKKYCSKHPILVKKYIYISKYYKVPK